MKSKQIVAFALMVCFILMAAGCGSSSSTAPAPAPADSTSQAASSTPQSVSQAEPAPEAGSWADIHKINDGSETVEELYEKAKEEGTVVLYSISSRCGKVKESFEAQYPGIVVEAYDISTNELLEKITREYDAGVRNADVVHIKDQDGSIYREMQLPGKLHSYYPEDICAHIDPDMMKYSLPMYVELCYLYYNEEIYDAPPVDSWWDLTKPEWNGRVILTNPLDNISYLAQFTAFTQNADALAQDYERVFGEPIVLDGTPNAGYELIKRLAANNLIFASSSDEIVEAVGTRGQTSAPHRLRLLGQDAQQGAKQLGPGCSHGL
ncbi:MAG: ABC transporter substrate-binding protein [Oscillospiraceae bacterium]